MRRLILEYKVLLLFRIAIDSVKFLRINLTLQPTLESLGDTSPTKVRDPRTIKPENAKRGPLTCAYFVPLVANNEYYSIFIDIE